MLYMVKIRFNRPSNGIAGHTRRTRRYISLAVDQDFVQAKTASALARFASDPDVLGLYDFLPEICPVQTDAPLVLECFAPILFIVGHPNADFLARMHVALYLNTRDLHLLFEFDLYPRRSFFLCHHSARPILLFVERNTNVFLRQHPLLCPFRPHAVFGYT